MQYQPGEAPRNKTKQTLKAETGTPGTQKEGGQDNRKQKQGLPTNTAAGDCMSSSDDLRNKQTGTTPKGDNGKVTSQPEKRDQSMETNDSKVTVQ